MPKWRHCVCDSCWTVLNPDREPLRIREEFRDEQPEPCCLCGKPHQSGIYTRFAPALCKLLGECK